jgi:hypothetical protein
MYKILTGKLFALIYLYKEVEGVITYSRQILKHEFKYNCLYRSPCTPSGMEWMHYS